VDYLRVLPFSHPTTVVLVDDNRGFLRSFELALNPDVPLVTFDSPAEAIDFVREYETIELFYSSCYKNYTGLIGHPTLERIIGLDLSRIYHRVYDADRFDPISVVVVDYDMPEQDGLKLCQEISDLPCKKVLLTGKASEELAIQALNAGIIDYYVSKNSDTVVADVENAIAKLQHAYFRDLSSPAIQTLTLDEGHFMKDPGFAEFFYQVRKEHAVVEYYVIGDPDGFLMLDRDGRASLFIVQTQATLDRVYEMASDAGAPEEVLFELETGRRILHFSEEKPLESYDPLSWSRALYPARVFPGEQPYYYTLIRSPRPYPIDSSTVLSFAQYLAALDAAAAA
jgi:CheY-like chemotaxis protein